MQQIKAAKPTSNSARGIYRERLLVALMLAATLIVCVVILTLRLPVFSKSLYIPFDTADFGKVKKGNQVKRAYRLLNLHPWSVTVIGLNAGCGCTQAATRKRLPFVLRPLEAADVLVTFDTYGFHGATERIVNVATSDSSTANRLHLRGTVQDERQKP